MSGRLLRNLLLNLLLKPKGTCGLILAEAGQQLLFETAGAGCLLEHNRATDSLIFCSRGKKTPVVV